VNIALTFDPARLAHQRLARGLAGDQQMPGAAVDEPLDALEDANQPAVAQQAGFHDGVGPDVLHVVDDGRPRRRRCRRCHETDGDGGMPRVDDVRLPQKPVA
jgi:hypothetical protein